MEFSTEVKKKFEEAGWFKGRKIILDSSFDQLPLFAKEFLESYADLTVNDCKTYSSPVTNSLIIKPDDSNIVLDIKEINTKLFRIGYFYPDHYAVVVDKDENTYLIGDQYFKMGKTLVSGIENILRDNWIESEEWDFEKKQWFKEDF